MAALSDCYLQGKREYRFDKPYINPYERLTAENREYEQGWAQAARCSNLTAADLRATAKNEEAYIRYLKEREATEIERKKQEYLKATRG